MRYLTLDSLPVVPLQLPSRAHGGPVSQNEIFKDHPMGEYGFTKEEWCLMALAKRTVSVFCLFLLVDLAR